MSPCVYLCTYYYRLLFITLLYLYCFWRIFGRINYWLCLFCFVSNFYVFFYCVPLASDMWPKFLVLTHSFMTCCVQYFLFGLSYVCSCKVLSYYCYLYELFLTCSTSFIILDFDIRDLIFTRCVILRGINDQFVRENLLLSLLVQIVLTSLCSYVFLKCTVILLVVSTWFYFIIVLQFSIENI